MKTSRLFLLSIITLQFYACSSSKDFVQRKSIVTTSSPEALKEFEKGRSTDDLWDANPQALEAYNNAISLDPEFAQAYMFRARLERRSSPEQKEADFKKAIELSSNLPESEKLWITAFVNSNTPDIGVAKLAFEKVDSLPGIDLIAQEWRKTFAEYYWQDYDIAIDAANNLSKIEPDNSSRWGDLAEMYALDQNYEKALTAAKKMLSLDPNSSTSHDKVAEFNLNLGNLVEAKEGFVKTKTIDPSYSSAHLALAAINIQLGEFEKAEQNILTGIKESKDEDKWDLYADLATFYFGIGLNDKGYEAAENCKYYPPSWGDSITMYHELLTEFSIKAGEWEKAISHSHIARKTEGIWPHHVHYMMAWEAIAQLKSGNLEEANGIIDELEARKSENMNAYRNASFYLALSQNNIEEAQKSLNQVDNEYLKSGMSVSLMKQLRLTNKNEQIQQICEDSSSKYSREILLAINQKQLKCE